jgi:site-specific recombinase XerD
MAETLEQTLAEYNAWLERQPLAAKTRIAYRLQVRQYGAYLTQRPPTSDDPLHTPFARDYAIRDYKTYLKTERQAKPTSVNLALAAIDHFHRFIGNDRPQVQRESLPAQAPRALKPDEQKPFCAPSSARRRYETRRLLVLSSTPPSASENVQRSTWKTCASLLARGFSSSAWAREIPIGKYH